MIDRATLKAEITKMLKGADLNAVTSKKVRKQLERQLSTDLTDRKSEINELIADVLRSSEEKEEVKEEEEVMEEEVKVKEEDANSSDSSLSDLDASPAPRRKRPAPKAAPSANGDEDESDSEGEGEGEGLTDEQLARRLQASENRLPRRRRAAAPAPKAKRRRSEPSGGSSGAGGFSKPCALSEPLAEVVGCDSMPRQHVVKRLWQIAKEREMFDPKNKQFIICDAQFQRLFGKKRVRMFGAMKYLKRHIKTIQEEEEEEEHR